MPFVAIRYDLRTAPFAEASHGDLYRACLEQSAWADEGKVADIITLTEHHGMDDGWLPAPVTFAAAVAAVTDNVRIMIGALVFPFHDPVRLAEQIAVVDITAGPGRLWLIAGAGYVERELAMAGIEPRGRGSLVERAIEVCRQAWTGEPFEYDGRTVQVTPRPVSSPEPMILMGGSSPAAARRAARLRVGFLPAIADPELERVYREAGEADGWGGGLVILPQDVGYLFVSEDPDRDWARLEPYFWYEAESYRALQSSDVRSVVSSAATSPEELRDEGLFRILTPDDAVAYISSQGPMGNVVLSPLIAGCPPEWGWESLRLFAERVRPNI
ncbi:MAG: LLM class flavin-dependent oxidoreductase [Actinomycetota bacterium]